MIVSQLLSQDASEITAPTALSTTQHLTDAVATKCLRGKQAFINPHAQRLLCASLRPVKCEPKAAKPKAAAKCKAAAKGKAQAKAAGKAKAKAKAKASPSPHQQAVRDNAKKVWTSAKQSFMERPAVATARYPLATCSQAWGLAERHDQRSD